MGRCCYSKRASEITRANCDLTIADSIACCDTVLQLIACSYAVANACPVLRQSTNKSSGVKPSVWMFEGSNLELLEA